MPLIANSTCTGKVASVFQSNNMVEVTLNEGTTVKCVVASNIFSSLLGINISYLPPVDTNVIVLYTGQNEGVSFVLGTIPSMTDYAAGQQSSATDSERFTGETFGDLKDESHYVGHRPAKDMVEGEYSLGNDYGVAMTLLKHMAKLQAGDLAKVECHLFDDMVRIVSDKFKHHTAFGDHEIYNDKGRINVRWLGTDKEHEALGLDKDTDAKFASTVENTVNSEASVEDKWAESGRWRFQSYIGHLGNFINFFLTDPIKHLADSAGASSGKFRMHVNDDGSFLVQSLGDIVLERVVKIPVPIEIGQYDDPEKILNSEAYSELNKDKLGKWKPSSSSKLYESVYQIREHARWFSHVYSMAQFHIDPRYEVRPDAEYLYPDKDSQDADRKQANDKGGYSPGTHQSYIYKYATIRIYKDGSILLMDTEGSAINMSNKDVTISAARNLNLEAANHITFQSGNDIVIKARRNIDVSAIKGGILQRCRAFHETLCELGTVFVESNADKLPAASLATEEVLPRVIDSKGFVVKSLFSGIKLVALKDIVLGSSLGRCLVKGLEIAMSATSIKLNNKIEITPATTTLSGLTSIAQASVTQFTPPWSDSLGVPIKPLGAAIPALSIVNPAVADPLLTQVLQTPLQSSPGNITEYQSLTQQLLWEKFTEGATDLDIQAYITERLGILGGVGNPYPGVKPLKGFTNTVPKLNEEVDNIDIFENKSNASNFAAFAFVYMSSLLERIGGVIAADTSVNPVEQTALKGEVANLDVAQQVELDSVMNISTLPVANFDIGKSMEGLGGSLQDMVNISPNTLTSLSTNLSKVSSIISVPALGAIPGGLTDFGPIGSISSGLTGNLSQIGSHLADSLPISLPSLPAGVPSMASLKAGLSNPLDSIKFPKALTDVASLPKSAIANISKLPSAANTTLGKSLTNVGKTVSSITTPVASPSKGAATYFVNNGVTNKTIQTIANS